MSNTDNISDLLERAQLGAQDAQHELIELVYEELRIMAHRNLHADHYALTLSTTALVNEAFVKLFSAKQLPFKGKSYFFGAAARAMRQVVIDLARQRRTQKHGAGHQRVSLDVDELAIDACASELLELDVALQELGQVDTRLSTIVECRFFGGMTDEQTSEVVGVTARTVRRDWRKARAWLYNQLQSSTHLSGETKQAAN